MLTQEFQVQGRHEFEGALIYWWKDGGTVAVITRVPTRTFEDLFNRPRATDAERRRLTQQQCTLLAESNIEELARVIAREYAARTSDGEGPRALELTAADIERSGEKLSDSVLDTAARSGWVGRDGTVSQ